MRFFWFPKKKKTTERKRNKRRLTLCCGFFFLFFYMNFFWRRFLFCVNQHHLHHLGLIIIHTSILLSLSRDSFCLPNFVKHCPNYSSQKQSIIEIMQFVGIAFIVCYMLNYWIATALCTYTRIVINFNHNFLAVMFNLLIACSAFLGLLFLALFFWFFDDENYVEWEEFFVIGEKFSWHWKI